MSNPQDTDATPPKRIDAHPYYGGRGDTDADRAAARARALEPDANAKQPTNTLRNALPTVANAPRHRRQTPAPAMSPALVKTATEDTTMSDAQHSDTPLSPSEMKKLADEFHDASVAGDASCDALGESYFFNFRKSVKHYIDAANEIAKLEADNEFDCYIHYALEVAAVAADGYQGESDAYGEVLDAINEAYAAARELLTATRAIDKAQATAAQPSIAEKSARASVARTKAAAAEKRKAASKAQTKARRAKK